MALYRVRHQIQLIASTDANERRIGFSRLEDTTTQTIRDDMTEGHAESRTIDKSTTDEVLAFGSVTTAKLLYLESDRALTIKINSGSETFKIAPTTGKLAKLFWEGEFTGVKVTNADTVNAAEITYLVAG